MGKLTLLNFALRLGLNKLLPWVFSPPAFLMVVQRSDLTYTQVRCLFVFILNRPFLTACPHK